MSNRRDIVLLAVVLAGLAAALAWTHSRSAIPPADFTFCNGTEVKSLDPQLVTGQPESRLAYSLFEGLVRWHPKTLEPLPSGAERWEISDDGLDYTFHLRKEAKWSDGSPVTARDYAYGLRRLLDPRTAAEYAMQGWYIKNARRYSGAASAIRPGEPVEVELNLSPTAINTLRGKVLRGTLKEIRDGAGKSLAAADLQQYAKRESVDRSGWTFEVEFDGQAETFQCLDDAAAERRKPPRGRRWCRQILLDFSEVGVAVVDDYTLKLTLEHPTSYFISLCGYYPLFPVNQKCVETFGSPQWTYAENMVSNGPYRQLFRKYRDRTRLVRSNAYWDRDNVKLDVVDVLAVDSVPTALNLFLTGKADWVHESPPYALREMLKEQPPRDDLNPAPFLSTYYYLLNVDREPLGDVRVRRALSMAIDRDEICTKILAAGERPALSLVPPGLPGYESAKSDGFDPAAARKLLADAGYPGGRGFPRLEITYNSHEAHQLIAEVVRKQWERNLGIVVKSRNEEWGSYLASLRQSRFDVCRRGWIGDYVDPNTFLELFVTGGEQNNTNWGRPDFDDLIAAAARENDPAQRLAIFTRAERILMDELPIVPLFFYVSKNMVKPYVRGFHNNVQDYHPVWAMSIDRDGKTPNDFLQGRK